MAREIEDTESVIGRFRTLDHRTFGVCVMDDNLGWICKCQNFRAANRIAYCLHSVEQSEETAVNDEGKATEEHEHDRSAAFAVSQSIKALNLAIRTCAERHLAVEIDMRTWSDVGGGSRDVYSASVKRIEVIRP